MVDCGEDDGGVAEVGPECCELGLETGEGRGGEPGRGGGDGDDGRGGVGVGGREGEGQVERGEVRDEVEVGRVAEQDGDRGVGGDGEGVRRGDGGGEDQLGVDCRHRAEFLRALIGGAEEVVGGERHVFGGEVWGEGGFGGGEAARSLREREQRL